MKKVMGNVKRSVFWSLFSAAHLPFQTCEKQYKFDEILPIYKVITEEETGTFADFMEAFKTYDREGQGFVAAAEARHVLTAMGERLRDDEVENILKYTGTEEDLDGNLKYEEFIKKVMAGPKFK